MITSHWCLLPIIQPHLAHGDDDDGDDEEEDGVNHLLIDRTILFLEWLFQDVAMYIYCRYDFLHMSYKSKDLYLHSRKRKIIIFFFDSSANLFFNLCRIF